MPLSSVDTLLPDAVPPVFGVDDWVPMPSAAPLIDGGVESANYVAISHSTYSCCLGVKVEVALSSVSDMLCRKSSTDGRAHTDARARTICS